MNNDDERYFQIDQHGIGPASKDTKANLWACARLDHFMAKMPDRLASVSITTCARCGVDIIFAHAEAGSVNRDATKVCIDCALVLVGNE